MKIKKWLVRWIFKSVKSIEFLAGAILIVDDVARGISCEKKRLKHGKDDELLAVGYVKTVQQPLANADVPGMAGLLPTW